MALRFCLLMKMSFLILILDLRPGYRFKPLISQKIKTGALIQRFFFYIVSMILRLLSNHM